MKKGKFLAVIAALAAAAGLCSAALAAGMQVKVIEVDAWGPGSNGGPFEVQPMNFGFAPAGLGKFGAQSTNFLTFCVETNETIAKGKTYDAALNTVAINGGSGGGVPDPLDARTAFLYSAFVHGSLSAKLATAGLSAFTYGTEPSGSDLQDAIWDIENENHKALTQLAKDLVTLANAAIGVGGEWYGKGINNVRILNLTSNNGQNDNQDLLVVVPLPSTIALGLVGLVGVIAYRRYRHF